MYDPGPEPVFTRARARPRPAPPWAAWLAGMLALAWVVPAAAASDYPFDVEAVKQGSEYGIVAINKGSAPIDAAMSLTQQDNFASDTPWPIHRVIPPGKRVEVAHVRAVNKARAYSFRYEASWLFGDPQARQDANATYRLPFADGLRFTIGQAPGGPLPTHNTPDTQYAVDITMPIGTPVLAARAGYVVENVRPYSAGRLDPDYLDKVNFVRILHDDGTWAVYAHLAQYGGNINPGMRVAAGAVIGMSGNSGYSSGPHLHFAVQKNEGGHIVSLPFRFYNVGLGSFAPVPNQVVVADYRPGAPALSSSPAQPTVASQISGSAKGTAAPEKKRSARECMNGRNVIDETVVACMNGGR